MWKVVSHLYDSIHYSVSLLLLVFVHVSNEISSLKVLVVISFKAEVCLLLLVLDIVCCASIEGIKISYVLVLVLCILVLEEIFDWINSLAEGDGEGGL